MRQCKRCGKPFNVGNQKFKIYCSAGCRSYARFIRNGKYKRRESKYQNVRVYREIILSFFGNECKLCRTNNNLQIHHILEKSKGGSNNYKNIMLLCSDCHINIHRK